MPESDQTLNITLPDELRAQFERLEKKLFRVETGALIAGWVAGPAGAYLLVFASDRFWNSPPWLRGAAFAGGAVVMGVVTARWLKKWVLKKRTQKDLATIVQRRFSRLGDRLLGIVELSSEEKHLHGFSPELYRAAIRQVAAESAQYDFTEAVSREGFQLVRRVAVIGGALAVLTILVFPKAGLNAAQRTVAPWRAIPRFTLVRLVDLPTEILTAHGEAFQLAGRVQYESFWKPGRVASWFGRVPSGQAAVQDNQFALQLGGRFQDETLRVKVGDAVAHIRVKPTVRPSLRDLNASIELPEYLRLPAREQNAQGGSLTVVEGAKASFRGQVSRPLRQADAIANTGDAIKTKIEADRFTTEPIAADNVTTAEFHWRDQLGFTNQQPWKLSIQTQKDGAPLPEFPDLSREVSILESEVVQLKIRARDDFGVRKLGLVWDLGLNATNQPYDFSTEAESTDRADLETQFTFTPLLLQVQPDTTVAVRGFATDFFPGREPIETPSYRIHVLGNEQHAEMVRQRLESVMARLEEVTRLEEKIASATAELQAKENLSDQELARRASELKDEQLQNAAALKDMAEEGMKNLREAIKNPTLDEKVLSEWSKTLNEMQKVASKPMQQAAQALGEAGKSPKDKKENLAKAEEKEKEILQDLQQMQKKVNKGLDDLQALTLAQRLRKMGTGQKEIHDELAKVIADTIGMVPDELSERYRKLNGFLAEQQLDSRNKSAELQGEISRFHERTRKPAYGQVSKEMTGNRTPDELERLRTLIEGNVSMQAMESLNLWATRFQDWADLLDPPKKESAPPSEGPPGEPEEEDFALRQLMALLRVREGQLNVRERTRMLDKTRADETTYRENAAKLHKTESELVKQVDAVQEENAEQEMESVLRDTGRSMKRVESMLAKPQTDEGAIKAQNDSLQLLTDAINILNEKAKKSQQSGEPGESQSEEMAFMMQMMQQQNPTPGMQGGMKPGMNMSGGSTDMAATPVTGNAVGRSDAPRTAKKAGGSVANAPVEFRDALENYYKALENTPQ